MDGQPPEITAVAKFLRAGTLSGMASSRLAKAIDDQMRLEAQQSLRTALRMSRRLVRVAAHSPAPLPLTAYRILARITHMAARHAEAEKAYLTARRLASTDKLIVARIDRALIDVYMYLGRLDEARRRSRLALKTFLALGASADAAMTRVNTGNLLHRQDKHKDAERIYALAQAFFEESGDELSVARCQYNRANALVQLFALDAAAPLYSASRDTYQKHSFELDATDARYGLAWVAMLRGEFHIALIELAACETAYRQFGQPKGTALCVLDRAEVYLGLNLLTDAVEAASHAEAKFRAMGHRYESSKAALFRSMAMVGMKNRGEATRSVRRATTGFAAEKNPGFLGVSYLVEAQNEKRESERSKMLNRARTRFARAQLPLWQAVCDLYLAENGNNIAASMSRLKANQAVKVVPHMFASWQTLLGDLADQKGERTRAVHHWRQAADRLDAVRAQLPPVELRDKFVGAAASPHAKLVIAELTRSVQVSAAWSERFKTAGIWAPIEKNVIAPEVRTRASLSLSALANQVAALARQLGGIAGSRGNLSTEAHRKIQQLQRVARLELSTVDRTAHGIVDPIENIVSETESLSRQSPIVQFHLSNDDILAFIHESGTSRVVTLAGGRTMLAEAMRQWRFILEKELLADHLPSSGRERSENQFFEKIGQRFWAPLEISRSVPRILLVPEGDLANLPWPALRLEGENLLERHQFWLSPSIRHFWRARNIKIERRSIRLFGGAAPDLPMVARELEELAGCSPNTASLYQKSTRDDWPVDGEDWIWHYAGHASIRRDNPFYSSLELQDGPLFAADFRLRSARVGLVTLAACRSGQQISMPGEESTGLVRSLLEMGARNVVAGHWPVSDHTTAIWMKRFYQSFLNGETLMRSANKAALGVREQFPSAYHWAAFSIFGAGE